MRECNAVGAVFKSVNPFGCKDCMRASLQFACSNSFFMIEYPRTE